MTSEEIRIEFIKKRNKTSMAKLARQLGVSQQAVQRVIDRKSVSKRIMEAIAKAIGKPVKNVFPERRDLWQLKAR